jgi:hypothetical protein
LQLVTNGAAFKSVVEWLPPTFGSIGQKAFLVQVFVAVVLLVRRPSYRTALPLAGFGVMALLSARNVVPASLVLLPGMAVAIGHAGSLDARARSSPFRVATVAIVAIAVPLSALSLSGEGADLRDYPVEAVQWLDARDQIDPDVRLLTQDVVGNYLEAEFGPDRVRVFIDDRVDMYPLQVTRDYMILLAGKPGWSRILNRYEAEVVLWEAERPLAELMVASSAWRLVYRDDDWIIAVPQDSPIRPDR